MVVQFLHKILIVTILHMDKLVTIIIQTIQLSDTELEVQLFDTSSQ